MEVKEMLTKKEGIKRKMNIKIKIKIKKKMMMMMAIGLKNLPQLEEGSSLIW